MYFIFFDFVMFKKRFFGEHEDDLIFLSRDGDLSFKLIKLDTRLAIYTSKPVDRSTRFMPCNGGIGLAALLSK